MSGEIKENQDYFPIWKDMTQKKALNVPSRALDLGIDWV